VKLLGCPPTAFNIIAEHISAVGWNGSCFSDDALSTRKMYPGFTFKHSKKGWEESGVE
jgi:hypothetical protein